MKKVLICLLVISIVLPANLSFASEQAGRININQYMGSNAAPRLVAFNTLDGPYTGEQTSVKKVDLNPAKLKSLEASQAYDFRRGGHRAGLIIGVTALVILTAVLIIVVAD